MGVLDYGFRGSQFGKRVMERFNAPSLFWSMGSLLRLFIVLRLALRRSNQPRLSLRVLGPRVHSLQLMHILEFGNFQVLLLADMVTSQRQKTWFGLHWLTTDFLFNV